MNNEDIVKSIDYSMAQFSPIMNAWILGGIQEPDPYLLQQDKLRHNKEMRPYREERKRKNKLSKQSRKINRGK